jgi:molybdate transport system substrate-binding protein
VSRVPRRRLNPSTILLAGVGILASFLVSSCSTTQHKTTIRVFATSSLNNAFADIADQFQIRNPDVRIEVVYGDSETLARRITQGAGADVFASAEPKQMRIVEGKGETSERPLAFVTNRLAVVTPRDNPAHIRSVRDLADPRVETVLASNDTPAGRYARTVLSKAGIEGKVDIVSTTSDAEGVVSKVSREQVDAGICYVTDVTPALSGNVFETVIPDRYNVPATYEIAPLSPSDLVVRFTNFVLSTGGQGILASYGFGRAPA